MCEQGHPAMAGVKAKLHNSDIWKQFHEHTTEMIITKSGRRMFPYLRVELSGLDPDQRYFVILEMNLSSNKRFKFNGAQWTAIGNAEPQLPPQSRVYVHPDSPAVGRHWMSQSVLFNKCKLTNHTLDQSGNVVLTSMHKYLPSIHIVMASDVCALRWSPTTVFSFPETEFIAVTAYQNDNITKLKIDNNPFAKGFRETGQSRLKRKLQQPKDTEEKDDTKDSKKKASPNHLPVVLDDSGISSVGSITPPLVSDVEEVVRPNPVKYERTTPSYHHVLSQTWMDIPLPPYPLVPPYHPSLWPYGPFLQYLHPLPPNQSSHLHPLYSHYSQALSPLYVPSPYGSEPEPLLIDLSIRREPDSKKLED